MPKLNWSTLDDIAFALYEKFPDLDPATIRFTDLGHQARSLSQVVQRNYRVRVQS